VQRLDLAADFALHVELEGRGHVAADIDTEIDVAFFGDRHEPRLRARCIPLSKVARTLQPPASSGEDNCGNGDQGDFLH